MVILANFFCVVAVVLPTVVPTVGSFTVTVVSSEEQASPILLKKS